MNSPLKFRAWDEKYNCWDSTPILWYPYEDCIKQGRTIQWFTGLTDKNDKEIWTGDILTYKTGVNGQVLYEADHGGYIFQYKRNGPNQNYINLNCDVAFESVIVGNIFENSELLK